MIKALKHLEEMPVLLDRLRRVTAQPIALLERLEAAGLEVRLPSDEPARACAAAEKGGTPSGPTPLPHTSSSSTRGPIPPVSKSVGEDRTPSTRLGEEALDAALEANRLRDLAQGPVRPEVSLGARTELEVRADRALAQFFTIAPVARDGRHLLAELKAAGVFAGLAWTVVNPDIGAAERQLRELRPGPIDARKEILLRLYAAFDDVAAVFWVNGGATAPPSVIGAELLENIRRRGVEVSYTPRPPLPTGEPFEDHEVHVREAQRFEEELREHRQHRCAHGRTVRCEYDLHRPPVVTARGWFHVRPEGGLGSRCLSPWPRSATVGQQGEGIA